MTWSSCAPCHSSSNCIWFVVFLDFEVLDVVSDIYFVDIFLNHHLLDMVTGYVHLAMHSSSHVRYFNMHKLINYGYRFINMDSTWMGDVRFVHGFPIFHVNVVLNIHVNIVSDIHVTYCGLLLFQHAYQATVKVVHASIQIDKNLVVYTTLSLKVKDGQQRGGNLDRTGPDLTMFQMDLDPTWTQVGSKSFRPRPTRSDLTCWIQILDPDADLDPDPDPNPEPNPDPDLDLAPDPILENFYINEKNLKIIGATGRRKLGMNSIIS
ncbi:hypothetical protein AMTRI_Chr02g258350 [Amborella trichopoda]